MRPIWAHGTLETASTTTDLGATGYSRVLGKKIELASSPEPERAERAEEMPLGVEQAQRQLRVAQWTIPLLTGALEEREGIS